MRDRIVLALLPALVILPLLACGGPRGGGAGAATPTPFAAQFTGTYLGPGPIARLVLQPDGTYAAVTAYELERGTFAASDDRALPLLFTLEGLETGTARVSAYDGRLQLGDELLILQRPTLSDEELCDATGGRWTDDDPDPASGLYCLCAPGKEFIPAEGGCTG